MITKEEIDQLDDAVRLPLPTRWADGGAYLGDSVFVNVSILLPRLLKSYRQQMKQLVEKDATIAKMRGSLEELLNCPMDVDQRTVTPDECSETNPNHVVVGLSVAFPKILKARQCL